MQVHALAHCPSVTVTKSGLQAHCWLWYRVALSCCATHTHTHTLSLVLLSEPQGPSLKPRGQLPQANPTLEDEKPRPMTP